MKFLAYSLVFCFCYLNTVASNEILKAFDVCGKEANPENNPNFLPNDDTYACIVKCVYITVGVHDSDGRVIMSGLEHILNRKFNENEKKRIKDCEDEFKTLNTCYRVSKTQNCIGKIFHNVQ